MAALPGGLERLAAWLVRRATAIAVTAIIAVMSVIAADHYLGLFQSLSPRWLQRTGKGLGEVAGNLAIISVGYYLWREIYIAMVKRAIIGPTTAPLKAVLHLLRLTHPLAGAMTVAAAALHGYLLWTGRLPLAEVIGLSALAVLVFMSGSGFLLAGGVGGAGMRTGHRFAGLAFVLLYILHNLTAG